MKFFYIGLLPFLLLLAAEQGCSLPFNRAGNGELKVVFFTDFDGSYARRNSCSASESESTQIKGSHEIRHQTNYYSDWNSHAQKCTEIIGHFLRAIGNMMTMDEHTSGTLNFRINASVNHAGECPDALPGISTLVIQATDDESSSCSSGEGFSCSGEKAAEPDVYSTYSDDLDSHNSEDGSEYEGESSGQIFGVLAEGQQRESSPSDDVSPAAEEKEEEEEWKEEEEQEGVREGLAEEGQEGEREGYEDGVAEEEQKGVQEELAVEEEQEGEREGLAGEEEQEGEREGLEEEGQEGVAIEEEQEGVHEGYEDELAEEEQEGEREGLAEEEEQKGVQEGLVEEEEQEGERLGLEEEEQEGVHEGYGDGVAKEEQEGEREGYEDGVAGEKQEGEREGLEEEEEGEREGLAEEEQKEAQEGLAEEEEQEGEREGYGDGVAGEEQEGVQEGLAEEEEQKGVQEGLAEEEQEGVHEGYEDELAEEEQEGEREGLAVEEEQEGEREGLAVEEEQEGEREGYEDGVAGEEQEEEREGLAGQEEQEGVQEGLAEEEEQEGVQEGLAEEEEQEGVQEGLAEEEEQEGVQEGLAEEEEQEGVHEGLAEEEQEGVHEGYEDELAEEEQEGEREGLAGEGEQKGVQEGLAEEEEQEGERLGLEEEEQEGVHEGYGDGVAEEEQEGEREGNEPQPHDEEIVTVQTDLEHAEPKIAETVDEDEESTNPVASVKGAQEDYVPETGEMSREEISEEFTTPLSTEQSSIADSLIPEKSAEGHQHYGTSQKVSPVDFSEANAVLASGAPWEFEAEVPNYGLEDTENEDQLASHEADEPVIPEFEPVALAPEKQSEDNEFSLGSSTTLRENPSNDDFLGKRESSEKTDVLGEKDRGIILAADDVQDQKTGKPGETDAATASSESDGVASYPLDSAEKEEISDFSGSEDIEETETNVEGAPTVDASKGLQENYFTKSSEDQTAFEEPTMQSNGQTGEDSKSCRPDPSHPDCPYDAEGKENKSAPSHYILISDTTDPSEANYRVKKVYLADGTPLNCKLNDRTIFPKSHYVPFRRTKHGVIAYRRPSTPAV